MLFWKTNMPHVFIEVTKLKHDNKFPYNHMWFIQEKYFQKSQYFI